MRCLIRMIPILCLGAVLASLPGIAPAQGQFSPVISVDNKAITQFEIDQRIKLLEIFRTPGDLPKLARDGLIEDRLKMAEIERAGMRLTDQGLQTALDDFASRANLTLDQFQTVLAQNGVDQATLRDFVKVGVTWRDLVRNRFGNKVTVTDAEIDRAIADQGGNGTAIEVLLSEIIIPAPPAQAAGAMATATRISRLTSTAAFSAEARQVSALPSRTNGGRLDWVPLTNFPPPLRPILLALSEGQVTAPLPITNGVALFQLRGVREVSGAAPGIASIDYATFYIAGGRTEAGLRAAADVAARVDTCDDLYGVAKGLPPEQLERADVPFAQIPQDVATVLAGLDPGEYSTALTTADGQALRFVMLCKRTPATEAPIDRETVTNQLRGQKLTAYADILLTQLRAAATITGQ